MRSKSYKLQDFEPWMELFLHPINQKLEQNKEYKGSSHNQEYMNTSAMFLILFWLFIIIWVHLLFFLVKSAGKYNACQNKLTISNISSWKNMISKNCQAWACQKQWIGSWLQSENAVNKKFWNSGKYKLEIWIVGKPKNLWYWWMIIFGWGLN